MRYEYETRGICSSRIYIEIEDGKVISARYRGGCPGNTLGISKLVEGMAVEDVISRLSGIKCGMKPTSCPDQLADALKQINAGLTQKEEQN
ncbi:MAG: TIGR03905 family TSCPD domain-containing protein [Clostridiales bacterium]|nr:TIGR03905 family TSCPD domain-containing protein [Clostridiales bacterium]